MSTSQVSPAPAIEPPFSSWLSQGRVSSNADILRIAPLLLLAYSFLIFPPELRFSVGSLAFPLYRIVILGFSYLLFLQALRGELRFSLPDFFILGASAWMAMSFMAIYPFDEAMVRFGGVVVDFAGSYFLARLSIRSIDDFRRWLVLLAPGLCFAGSIVFLESVSREIFWRPFFIELVGPRPIYAAGEEIGTLETVTELRLGLARGYGPFSHQILAGAVLVSVLPLYFKSGLRSWPRWVGIFTAICGIFSLSSAAILGLITAAGLLIADGAKRMVEGIRWPVVAALGSLALLATHLLTQNGLIHFLSRLTLNPQTAFYRKIIWQYGWESMLNNPIFGIGYHQHERPSWLASSVDAHFLAIAMRNGIPAALLLLAAFLLVIGVLGAKASRATGREREFLIGLNIALATLLMLSMTVMFFSEANIWLMLVLGAAGSLAARRSVSSS